MRYLTFVVLLLALNAPALADLKLEYHEQSGAHAFSMYVKGQRMRLETYGDHPNATLFNAETRELVILETSKQQYTVLDQATMRQLRAQMEQALAMARQYGMDPAAMGLGQFTKIETRTVRTGEMRTIDGKRCNVVRYEVGDNVTIACVVTASSLGISDDEVATLGGMFEALSEMTAQMLPEGGHSFDMQPAEGIPIFTSAADGSDAMTLAGVDHSPLADSLFEVPRGWRRVRLDR